MACVDIGDFGPSANAVVADFISFAYTTVFNFGLAGELACGYLSLSHVTTQTQAYMHFLLLEILYILCV